MAIEATANNDLRNIMPAKPEERQEVTPAHKLIRSEQECVESVHVNIHAVFILQTVPMSSKNKQKIGVILY